MAGWLVLSGCIEHRPEDTTVARTNETAAKPAEKKLKGLRVYAGTVPCADCPGIEQHLSMKGDSSGIYRLSETYKNATQDGDEVLVSNGEWKRFRDKKTKQPIYYLSENNLKDSTRIIRYQVYNDRIVQLDITGDSISNPRAYTLKLVGRRAD